MVFSPSDLHVTSHVHHEQTATLLVGTAGTTLTVCKFLPPLLDEPSGLHFLCSNLPIMVVKANSIVTSLFSCLTPVLRQFRVMQ